MILNIKRKRALTMIDVTKKELANGVKVGGLVVTMDFKIRLLSLGSTFDKEHRNQKNIVIHYKFNQVPYRDRSSF